MKPAIEIGKQGKIEAGTGVGSQVKIIHDTNDTHGYFILVSEDFSNPDSEEYDSWVESFDALEKHFEDSNWVVSWNKE